MSEDAIEHEGLDWSGVVAATYRVDQTIWYEYDSPVRDLRHRLVIAPRAAHGDQRRISHELQVTPDAARRMRMDAFGNDVVKLDVPHVERRIAFTMRSEVQRDARLGEHLVSVRAIDDPALLGERRLIRVDEALADAAADLYALHPRRSDRAEAIVRFVHNEMVYTKGATDVFTTASVAFSMRRGVCQDYAHVAIALARACGLTARYVSGHLLGEGATHAWVEFLIPVGRDAVRVLSFDPTIGRSTDWRYLVVAVGRDFDDVTPTSGVFTGTSAGAVGSRQVLRIVSLTRAA